MNKHTENYQKRMMLKDHVTITSEQVENFYKYEQLDDLLEILKDIANGDYSPLQLKQDIFKNHSVSN